jgi:hypothetical protein
MSEVKSGITVSVVSSGPRPGVKWEKRALLETVTANHFTGC